MALGLVFLLLSAAFTVGWMLGSALGYQSGRHDAEQLAELQAELVRSIELHLTDSEPDSEAAPQLT